MCSSDLDLSKETGDKWEHSDYFNFKRFERMVDEMRYADAAVYISTHMKSWWWHKYNYEEKPEKFVDAVSHFMEKKFDETIYKRAGEEVFDYTSIAKGEKVKGSKWKIVVKSNGQVVERL